MMNNKRKDSNQLGPNQSKAAKVVFFNGGSNVDYILAKSKFKNEFNKRGCFHLVDFPINMVENPTPNSDEVKLMEVKLDTKEPKYEEEVDVKIKDYENQCHEFYLKRVEKINSRNFENGVREVKLDEAEEDFDKKMFGVTELRNKYENTFSTKLSLWESKNKEFTDLQNKCIEVFTTYLGVQVLQLINEDLSNRRLRTAWYKLNKQYGSSKHNHNTERTLMRVLATMKFDGRSMEYHIDKFHTIMEHCCAYGNSIDDRMKLTYLLNTLDDTKGIHLYKETLSHVHFNHTTYMEVISLLKDRYSQLVLNRQLNKGLVNETQNANQVRISNETASSNERANVVNKPKLKCTTCNKNNHTAEQCWKNLACPHCGKTGHSPKKCFKLNQNKPVSLVDGFKQAQSKND